MDSVISYLKDGYHVVHINKFDDYLKGKIRENLTKICHGLSRSTTKRTIYSYKATLKEFVKRYKDKKESTKKGMIGELLAHIFILDLYPRFNTVSPFFNLEERSIKKGFDVVLYDQNESTIWITEVKSGEKHKDKDSNQTNKILLDKAKIDLKERLNEENSTLWVNAINGASISLDKYSDQKKAVVEILEDVTDTIIEEIQTSKDKNVFLISSLFSPLSDKIDADLVKEYHEQYLTEKVFKNILVMSIQKETYNKIIEFIIEESEE